MATLRRYALAAFLSSTAVATSAGVVASCSDAESTTPRGEPLPDRDASSDAAHDAAIDTLPDAPEEPGPDGGPSPIISEDPKSAYEGETQVAVAPDGTVGVAWIATAAGDTFASVAYRFSLDGGASWTPVRYVTNPSGTFSSDPMIAVAPNGDFYIGWLAVALSPTAVPQARAMVGRVSAGSDAIASYTEASDPASPNIARDHGKMTVMPDGTVVTAYLEAPSYDQPEGPGVASYSADQGATWKHAVIHDVAPGEFVNLFFLCRPVDGGGRLYATYFYEATIPDILVRYSDDDGASWSVPVSLNDGTIQAGGDDPTCVAKGNDVWVAFGVSNLPQIDETSAQPQQGIRLAHSSDKGVSFSELVDATDMSTGKVFMHPAIALTDDGAIEIVTYAGQAEADPSGALWRRRWSAGAFAPSQVVAKPITYELERATPNWLGDYIGAVGAGGALHVAYTDNSSGMSHVAYQRLPIVAQKN